MNFNNKQCKLKTAKEAFIGVKTILIPFSSQYMLRWRFDIAST